MKFIDDAIKESEQRMEENAPEVLSSDIDEDLMEIIKGVKTNIFVVGAGGAGNNTISRLNEMGIEGATTIAVNTDAQDLFYTQSNKKILLGRQTSKGLGAGGDPSVGEECADKRRLPAKHLRGLFDGTVQLHVRQPFRVKVAASYDQTAEILYG